MAHMGVLTRKVESNHQLEIVHYYKVLEFEGDPKPTEEMIPIWFSVNDLPYDEMWPSDRHWFPIYLKGERFRGFFLYDINNHLVNHFVEKIGEDAALDPLLTLPNGHDQH